ncbi:MAG: hypothetical protein L0Y72_25365 [Gemmataceae bacterium]|nr:hypothetical protein [Gemmataceae bacterium]MCI0742375.1 hypothetical protein [Gemmataceae bacterium]
MVGWCMLFGVFLTLLGGALYHFSDPKAITALFPAFFGIALFVLGIVAFNSNARKHAMHLAALLGLVGWGFPAYRVVKSMGGDDFEWNLAIWGQIGMSVLCGLFLIMCIRSFFAARRARKQGA